MRLRWLVCALLGSAGTAHASDTPHYAAAPAWVTPAPPLDLGKIDETSPATLILDTQTQLKGGVTWSYVDTAMRVSSAQALRELGTISVPWMPDRGDLIVHRAEILRAGETIDLLKGGSRFTVLRREEMMEQSVLTGMLTATLSVEGLRIGDVIRVTLSISQSDPALKGRAMGVVMVPAAPFRAQFARARFLWPAADKIAWRGYADGLKPVEKTADGMHEIAFALPLAKQPDMPGDLPARLAKPTFVEASGFADWADVSRTMAPLYATDGLIAPGSPLAAEVAAIAKAESEPLRRTERALELVQDKIRYLAIAMNGGGLTPQPPARTWELRYGDCKAKTLLLLAILHQLGIEAEPAVVSAQTNDFVASRLPSAAAFDHVIVRARVAGETLWLDGTGVGARLEDIRDVPGFGHVLPLRAAGAGLEAVPIHADARPRRTVDITWNESAGVDFPAAFDVTITARGPFAQALGAMVAQADAEQKRNFVQSMVQQDVGEAQIARQSVRYDPADGAVTVTASGVTTTPWWRDSGRYRRNIDRAVAAIDFTPDRSRAAWRDIPVATNGPDSVLYRTTVILPKGVTGYTLEGDQTLPATIGGRKVTRTAKLEDGRLILADRIDSIGAEIAPAALAAERAVYARAQANLLRVVAPAILPTRWQTVAAGRGDGRFQAIESAFAAAIAQDPSEQTGYMSRASFRSGIYDRQGAIADYSKAIELGDTVDLRLKRGALYVALGDNAKAAADYSAALALDPSSDAAVNALAETRAHGGDVKTAIASLDERIARGDRNRFDAVATKAELLMETGEAAAAVTMLDAALVEQPSNTTLLNERCWVKGAGNVAAALPGALKDCTRAIELSSSTASVLDSRAMVYYRMGRTDEALADLNAALEASPNAAGSLFMRGLILSRQGKAEGKADLAAARGIDPQVDATYKRFGITA